MTSHPLAAAAAPCSRGGLRWGIVETIWIFLIFFLAAATPTPDAGESHYWVKARHSWNPAWCPGDLFLESRDAHLTFDWTFGWLTLIGSLDVATWIARLVAWGLLAWAWRRLSWAIVPVPLWSLVSAGVMLLLARHLHLSRELVLRGGVEAKTVAYVFVFLALEAVARGRWSAALLLAGGAGAFHVLVGGWLAVAVGCACFAWCLTSKERLDYRAISLAAVGGLLLALPGLVPALLLNQGADVETTREAARIYVFERLPHHLVFHRFEPWFIARFAALVAVWVALAIWTGRFCPRLVPVQLVVAGAVLLAVVGVLLDQGAVLNERMESRGYLEYQQRAATWLRYYWFRLADVLVPVGAALALVAGIQQLQTLRPQLANWLLVVAIVVAGGDLVLVRRERGEQRLPGAALQQQQRDARRWADWRAACRWIERNTPPAAKFLTPRQQQTFKWHAQRAEVATWKDIPQDARGIVAWERARSEVYPASLAHRRHDLGAFTDAELVALAHKYGATYLLLDQSIAGRPILLPKVYPLAGETNDSFTVFRVPARVGP
ncbi:MAG: DUF6798 domain-containing protein [Pirellulaceae bacterium]|nr:DUF6798 domain-containing protein [Pirellulaceae bacterium]